MPSLFQARKNSNSIFPKMFDPEASKNVGKSSQSRNLEEIRKKLLSKQEVHQSKRDT